MALWGQDSKDADRPKHLNADEGVRSVNAAFQTESGWEVPLDGTDPKDGLTEVLAAQSNPRRDETGQAPNFYFPQPDDGSNLTGKVGELFEVFVKTSDVDGDVNAETTVLTDLSSPLFATFQDLGNGVGRYSGTPTIDGIETFAVEAEDSGGNTNSRSFQVTVSA